MGGARKPGLEERGWRGGVLLCAWEASAPPLPCSSFALSARFGRRLPAGAVHIFDVPVQLEHKAGLTVDTSEFLIVTSHGLQHAVPGFQDATP